MSIRSTSSSARSGHLPSRAAVVHTLPATSRPGRRSPTPTAGNQLGVRTRAVSRDRTAASVLASRVVFLLSCVTGTVLLVEPWSR